MTPRSTACGGLARCRRRGVVSLAVVLIVVVFGSRPLPAQAAAEASIPWSRYLPQRCRAALRLAPAALIERGSALTAWKFLEDPEVARFLLPPGTTARTWLALGADQLEMLTGVERDVLGRAELLAAFLGWKTTRDRESITVLPDLALVLRGLPPADAEALWDAAQPGIDALTGVAGEPVAAGERSLRCWVTRWLGGVEIYGGVVGDALILATSRSTWTELATRRSESPDGTGLVARSAFSTFDDVFDSREALVTACLDLAAVAEDVAAELPEEVTTLLSPRGLGRLHALSYVLVPEPPGFVERVRVYAPAAGGMLQQMAPATGAPAAHDDAAASASLALSWVGLHDGFRALAARLEPRVVEAMDALDVRVRQATGQGLREDLLPALGDGLRVEAAWRRVGPWPDIVLVLPLRDPDVVDAALRHLGRGSGLAFALPAKDGAQDGAKDGAPRRAVKLDRLVKPGRLGPSWCATRRGTRLYVAPWAQALHVLPREASEAAAPERVLDLDLDLQGSVLRGLELVTPLYQMTRPRLLGRRLRWAALPPAERLARPWGRLRVRGVRREGGLELRAESPLPVLPALIAGLWASVLR